MMLCIRFTLKPMPDSIVASFLFANKIAIQYRDTCMFTLLTMKTLKIQCLEQIIMLKGDNTEYKKMFDKEVQ